MSEFSSNFKPRNVVQLTKGIFELAYEKPLPPSYMKVSKLFRECREHLPFAVRLLTQLMVISPLSCMVYAGACLWMALAPACFLFFTAILLTEIEALLHDQLTIHILRIQNVVGLWCLVAFVSSVAARLITKHSRLLSAHMKLYFYPEFAKVSLTLNSSVLNEQVSRHLLPSPWGYERESAVGWEFVKSLSTFLGDVLSLLSLCIVLAFSLYNTTTLQGRLVYGSCLFSSILGLFLPCNGVYGAGYTFWTTNAAYHRLAGLHSIVFDSTYRQTIIKDGAERYLRQDYANTLRQLGIMELDAEVLHYGLHRPLYWDFLRDLCAALPLGLAALTLSRSAAAPSLTSVVLAKQSSKLLHDVGQKLETSQSLSDILKMARDFYQTLELCNQKDEDFSEQAPEVPSRGMSVSFRNVYFQYDGEEKGAVRDVSFDIPAGQVVLLLGFNGSGKTTLLKLLSGLIEPTSGHILVDDKSLKEYDMSHFRSRTAILCQNEAIYPVSLRDNLLLGLADSSLAHDADVQSKLDTATRMGNSYDFIRRVGYDRILEPVGYLATSSEIFGNGPIGDGALEAMRLNNPRIISTPLPISGGERQRFIISRFFMRLNNKPIRLVVIDETSALDLHTEREILDRILDQREGRTTILVTHHFGPFVNRVDSILVMGAGELLQHGTHEELIVNEQGEYAKLYRAQYLS